MLNRLATIRDQKLSLWQSAVEEVAEKLGDSAQRKSMLEGVTLHILSEERQGGPPRWPAFVGSRGGGGPSEGVRVPVEEVVREGQRRA